MHVWRAPVYAWNSIRRLLGVKNYLNNYIAIYNHLTSFCLRVNLASRTYLGLRII